jgi:dienelactone hydrolase
MANRHLAARSFIQRQLLSLRTSHIVLAALLCCAWGASSSPVFAAEPTKNSVPDQPFVADFYFTEGMPSKPGILVLGGAEGGKPEHLARLFAAQGYPVLSLAYFKTKGTPDYLDMIPLEYFGPAIDWLSRQAHVRSGGIIVVGGSKGAELALLLAAKNPTIKGVIAIAPSSVVWQGIPKDFFPPRSSWSQDGQGIDYVPYDYSKGLPDPSNLLALYTQSLTQAQFATAAAIEVEKINGPILLLCGSDDKLWPSQAMAQAITQRLKEKNFKHSCELVNYPNAGHTLNEFFMIGGTKEGNKEARIDSSARMLGFLAKSIVDPAPAAAP